MEHEFKWVCAVPLASGCGEGAVWAEAEQALYWTDVTRFLLLRLTPRDGCVKTWLFDEPVVALSLTDRVGRLLVALGSHLILWTAATDERVNYGVWLNGWPQVRFNEGRSGPDGSFWVGSMRNNVNTDGSLREAGGSDGILMRVGPGTQTSIQGADWGSPIRCVGHQTIAGSFLATPWRTCSTSPTIGMEFFQTGILSSRDSNVVCQMALPSTQKASSGTVGSAEAVSYGFLQKAKWIG